jgi:hypothetical protein
VSLERFHRGEFPAVYAKTGERADRLLPVRALHAPGWTWMLLPFGGFWAFLIARGFTTVETTGLVPFSGRALARLRARWRRRLAAFAIGALLLLIVLNRSWGPALLLIAAPIAILFGWLSDGVFGADVVGARFDPEGGTVLLWGVHEAFRRAVESGQQPDPSLRHWQSGGRVEPWGDESA